VVTVMKGGCSGVLATGIGWGRLLPLSNALWPSTCREGATGRPADEALAHLLSGGNDALGEFGELGLDGFLVDGAEGASGEELRKSIGARRNGGSDAHCERSKHPYPTHRESVLLLQDGSRGGTLQPEDTAAVTAT
jgi:hypothetical protein